DGVNAYSLEGALKPFVVCGGCLVDSLLLSPHCALSTGSNLTGHLHQFFPIHLNDAERETHSSLGEMEDL
ncbi:hypothetical protein, partial [Salmonella enterica]|uniref:hypothetical protein n=1 Tax=Salmonella enterica TaxID=28901 RepID=UPI0032992368